MVGRYWASPFAEVAALCRSDTSKPHRSEAADSRASWRDAPRSSFDDVMRPSPRATGGPVIHMSTTQWRVDFHSQFTSGSPILGARRELPRGTSPFACLSIFLFSGSVLRSSDARRAWRWRSASTCCSSSSCSASANSHPASTSLRTRLWSSLFGVPNESAAGCSGEDRDSSHANSTGEVQAANQAAPHRDPVQADDRSAEVDAVG